MPIRTRFALTVVFFILSWPVLSQETVQQKQAMTFASVVQFNARVRVKDGQLDTAAPGWFIELSRKAAAACNIELEFVFLPWPRVLKMVEFGSVSAAFNSSYKTERAVYGVYPLKDGQPDEARAARHYEYSIYVHRDSDDLELVSIQNLTNRRVVAERGASILDKVYQEGVLVEEIAVYDNMIGMVSRKRINAAVGIPSHLDAILQQRPEYQATVRKLAKPYKKSVGYVMFSKVAFAQYPALAECYWSEAAAIRQTSWFSQMRARYPDQ